MSQSDIANIVAALGGWLSNRGWKEYSGNCPQCNHGVKRVRYVGAPLIGHNQYSCPCRIIRQEQNPQHPCGCEWTEDERGILSGGGGGGGGGSTGGDKPGHAGAGGNGPKH